MPKPSNILAGSAWADESEELIMKTLKPRILYVEDHEDTRELIALILRESQFAVTTAATNPRTYSPSMADVRWLRKLPSTGRLGINAAMTRL